MLIPAHMSKNILMKKFMKMTNYKTQLNVSKITSKNLKISLDNLPKDKMFLSTLIS